jgi:twitching motility two-component system response regulator PilH
MAVQTILVVDDSPTALQLISEPLTANGYQVITASDGEEALMRARQEMPDLIVLDIILPKLNGFQVCRQLKTDPATEGLKILLLSSKNQDSDKFWGEKQGADAYVTKPFEDEELLAGIRQLLAGRAVVH